MPLSLKCPSCQQVLSVPDSLAGKNVKCPKCGTVLAISEKQAAGVQSSGETKSDSETKTTSEEPPPLSIPKKLPAKSKEPASASGKRNVSPEPKSDRYTEKVNAAITRCDKCHGKIRVKTSVIGKKLRCPKCKGAFVAQELGAASSSVADPALVPANSESVSNSEASAALDTPAAQPFSDDPFGGLDEAAAPQSDPFSAGDDPFGGPALTNAAPQDDSAFAGGGFSAPAAGAGNFAAPGQPAFAAGAPANPQNAASKRPKKDESVKMAVNYRVPAVIGLGCVVLNVLIILPVGILAILGAFPRVTIIVFMVGLMGSALGAQAYSLTGFLGTLNMGDRHGGIYAARTILACPFIVAVILFLGAGFFGIPIAAVLWVFMMLYNWPIGWWLWLKLEHKDAEKHFGEIRYDENEVASLLSGKKKQTAPAAAATAGANQPTFAAPAYGAQPAKAEPKKKAGMSPKAKKTLLLGGAGLAALLLVGGGVTFIVSSFSGGSNEPAVALPAAPEG